VSSGREVQSRELHALRFADAVTPSPAVLGMGASGGAAEATSITCSKSPGPARFAGSVSASTNAVTRPKTRCDAVTARSATTL